MKAVIQRVSQASITINNEKICSINQGIVLLLGIESSDDYKVIEWMVQKIINLRIFNDNIGKMNLSLQDVNGELMVVSQFTLLGDAQKGNRPSYIQAARPETAINIYEKFLEQCKTILGNRVKEGVFGADMKVNLTNDGPVTILLTR